MYQRGGRRRRSRVRSTGKPKRKSPRRPKRTPRKRRVAKGRKGKMMLSFGKPSAEVPASAQQRVSALEGADGGQGQDVFLSRMDKGMPFPIKSTSKPPSRYGRTLRFGRPSGRAATPPRVRSPSPSAAEPEPQLESPLVLHDVPLSPVARSRSDSDDEGRPEEGEAHNIEMMALPVPPAFRGKFAAALKAAVMDKLTDIAADIECKGKGGYRPAALRGQSEIPAPAEIKKDLKEMLNDNILGSLCYGGFDKKGGKPDGRRKKSGTKGRGTSPVNYYCISGIVNHFAKNTTIEVEGGKLQSKDVKAFNEKVWELGTPIESDGRRTRSQKASDELVKFGKEFRQRYTLRRRGEGGEIKDKARTPQATKKALEGAIAESQILYHNRVARK